MKNSKPKILFVSNTSFSMWNFRGHILKYFKKKDFDIFCASIEDSTSQNIKDLGAKFISLNLSRSGSNILKEISSVFQLFKVLKSVRPDIIFTYTIKPNSYVPILARIFKIPIIAVVTGLGYAFLQNDFKAKISRGILKFGLLFANKILFLNDDDRNLICSNNYFLISKSDIIDGEGVDTQFFKPSLSKPKIFTFIMVARLLKDKGIYEYAHAAKQIKKTYKNIEFQVLGALDDGNPSGITQKEWQKLCDDCGIDYLGTTNDVRPFLAVASVCVLPSYREGMPVSLLEAGAMGLPLIATDVAGCRDVVQDGLNGFLVKPKDTTDLIRAMINMIEIRSDRFEDMKIKTREMVVQKFDNQIIVKKYIEMLNGLMEQNEK